VRIILQFLLVISTSTLFAQIPTSLLKSAEEVFTFDDYTGSIYKTLGQRESTLIDEKSGTYDSKLRYNIYSDVIEYKKDDKLFNIVKNKTTHARINGDYFYYCEFVDQRNRDKSGYYVLVELNEDYRIYKKYFIDVVAPQLKTITGKADTQGKLLLETTYYLEEENIIMELPMDKKEMLAVLSDKGNELSRYIKSERIKVRKEEDLIRLVSRYNALKRSDIGPIRSLLSSNKRR